MRYVLFAYVGTMCSIFNKFIFILQSVPLKADKTSNTEPCQCYRGGQEDHTRKEKISCSPLEKSADQGSPEAKGSDS